MAFEKGNDYAKKGKLWGNMLRRAITQEDSLRVRQAVEQLLDQAAAGERWAIIELADRLDGKAQQSIEVSGEVSYQPFLSAAEKLKAKIKGEAIDVDSIHTETRVQNDPVTLAVAHVIMDETSSGD